MPIKTKRLTETSKPWFKSKIRKLIKCRDRAYTRWKRFKTNNLKEEYRTARRKINYEINKRKREYFENRFKSAGDTN